MSRRPAQPRLAWALTGSGHYFTECLELIREVGDCDLFVTRAAAEVIRMYRKQFEALPKGTRLIKDTTASAAPVGAFYHGDYHTLVVAPATSNTVAKCVAGISDTLVTNLYAQAGKCRIPSIVFACDCEPTVITEAPGQTVTLYPRPIDLENTERLKRFPYTQVAENIEALKSAIDQRMTCLSTSSS